VRIPWRKTGTFKSVTPKGDAVLDTLRWVGESDGHLDLLDQTLLPGEVKILALHDLAGVIDAIVRLAVRGAPAIGVAAAYGMVLGVRESAPSLGFEEALRRVGAELKASRPTAVNLSWAVQRIYQRGQTDPSLQALLAEAHTIRAEDEDLCRRMGTHGAGLIQDGMTILTHCNAGRLATSGDGTALSLMFEAWRRGTRFSVLADETRPLLQGARLTALELHEAGIPVEVIPDSAAAGLMARGDIDLVITGADRIAANGDAANKVGTYGVALAAAAHQVPMYIAAPFSTFDLSLANGSLIPIEDRDPEEVLCVNGTRVAPEGVGARNPAFDITPAELLTGLVTDQGLIAPISTAAIQAVLA
jgi:methylthioribose-1-phosphate isomerase